MEPLTLFTWGYWGWGSCVPQLLHAVDAVEAARGYDPPLFVDIRMSRDVRAVGFTGDAFAKIAGASRYVWMKDLGNEAITQGGELRIKNPDAAETLLDLAIARAQKKQRVIFFCACEFPGTEDDLNCHRVRVASYLLEAARKRGVPAHVVEWPGGEPRLGSFGVQLSEEAFAKVHRGSRSVPLEDSVPFAQAAGLPFCSLVAVCQKGGESGPLYLILSGPARHKKTGWYLPLFEDIAPDLSHDEICRRIEELRKNTGFVTRLS